MTMFLRNREHSETAFAFDEDLKFKARVRSNSLIGYWAAQRLGLVGLAADLYAKDIVRIDLDKPDADSVFRKIRSDFYAHDVHQSDHRIRRTMDELRMRAAQEFKAET